jgi:hypothetical protein
LTGTAGVAQFLSARTNVTSGQCLGFVTDDHGACSTTNIAEDVATAPANGATVSNLYAEVSAAPTGGESYTIDVMDNGTAIYSCSITAGNSSCTNTAGGVGVSSGHRLQVKITHVGGAPNAKFRASFRY